jgi:hypothetical protein
MNRSRNSWLIGSIAAVVLALAFSLSPLTVIFGAAAIAMCWRTTARLDAGERIWVARMLTIGVGARFAFAAGLLLLTSPMREPFLTLFPDGAYTLNRSLWIRNAWLGVTIGPHQALQIVEPYGASSYPLLLAAIQYLLGPSPYGLVLMNATLYVAGVLLLYRIVDDEYGHAISAYGLGLLLLWPSLFVWSVSVLRESFQFFVMSVAAAASYYLLRSTSRWTVRLLSAICAGVALFVLSTLRAGVLELTIVAIVLALAFRAISARPWLAIVGVVLAVVVLTVERERFVNTVIIAASRHLGFQANGQPYQLLDDKFYAGGAEAIVTMTFGECVEYLVRAAVAFVTVPAPWQAASMSELVFVPQQVCWYVMVVAAVAGACAGFRTRPWLTSILLGFSIGGLIVIAPNSGNVGTLIRHRDMITPFVLWLGAIGVVSAARRFVPARTEAFA